MNCEIYREMCGLNDVQSFLFISGIVSTGMVFSFVLTAFNFFGLGSMFEKEHVEEEEEEEEESEDVQFLKKYDINEANNSNKDEKSISESVVLETTPNGIVMMKYSYEDESFLYWSEFNRITYSEVLTVARKFVSTYNCAALYVLGSESTTDASGNSVSGSATDASGNDVNETTEEEEEKPAKKSVFADLKSNKKKKDRINLDEQTFETNRFIRMGSFNDFKHVVSNKETTSKEEKQISYSLFKSMSLS